MKILILLTRSRTSALFSVTLLVASLTACSTGKRISTDWATVGSTPRTAVKERFGEPAEYYENGRILAYRLVRKDSGYFGRYDEEFTLSPPGEARENLIFTFDENGVLIDISRIGLKD